MGDRQALEGELVEALEQVVGDPQLAQRALDGCLPDAHRTDQYRRACILDRGASSLDTCVALEQPQQRACRAAGSAEVLGEVRGKLVEIVGQLDLAAQRPEGLRDGAAALHRDQSGGRTPGALNDDLLAALGELDKPRELALGFMHSDTTTVTR